MSMKRIAHWLGWALVGLAALLVLPILLAAVSGDGGALQALVFGGLLSAFVGGGLVLTSRGRQGDLNKQEAYLLLLVLWVVLPCFAAIPLQVGPWSISLAESVFETSAALTTTGGSLLEERGAGSPAMLLWRSLLQWAGGLMSVTLLVVLLTQLNVAGLILFQNALPHGEGGTGAGQRLIATLRDLSWIYGLITLICAGLLWLLGVPALDGLSLAMAAVSTGGFVPASAQAAIGSGWVQYVLMIFMLAGALNLTNIWAVAHGRWRALQRDPEWRYLGVTVLVVLALLFASFALSGYGSSLTQLRQAAFVVISAITTTGFLDPGVDYGLMVSPVLLILLLLLGGGTASTTGGIRLLRVAVLFKQAQRELYRLSHPHGVRSLRLGERRIGDRTIRAVWSFFFALIGFTALIAILLSLLGLEPVAAVMASLAMLTNAGPFAPVLAPELGRLGDLGDASLIVLSAAMLLARLELLTFLMLIYPSYWRD